MENQLDVPETEELCIHVYTCVHVYVCAYDKTGSSDSSGILLPSSPSLALNRLLASVRAMIRKGYRKTEIFSWQ